MNKLDIKKLAEYTTNIYTLISKYDILNVARCLLTAFTIQEMDVESIQKNNLIEKFYDNFHLKFSYKNADFIYIIESLEILVKSNFIQIVSDEINIITMKEIDYDFAKGTKNLIKELEKISDESFFRMVVQYA